MFRRKRKIEDAVDTLSRSINHLAQGIRHMALTQEETNNLLAELGKVQFSGMTQEQVEAAIAEKLQPLVDAQAADTAAFDEIRAKLAELEGTDTNVETVINAIKDVLPKAAANPGT